MKLLTETIRKQLLRNGVIRLALEEKGEAEADFIPIVKLFTPDAGCTWLLTEIDPEDQDIAFGLCDLGMGCPELGSVRLSELETARGKIGLPVERDMHFVARHTISIYARAAWNNAAITECEVALRQAAEALAAEAAAAEGHPPH